MPSRRKSRKVLWVFTRPPQYAGGEQWQNVTWMRWIRSGVRVTGMMQRYAYNYQCPYRSAPVTDSIDALSPPKPKGKSCRPPMVQLVDPALLENPQPETLYLEPRDKYDCALLGHTREPQDTELRPPGIVVAVYCRGCVEKVTRDLLGIDDDDEVCEFVDYNIVAAWLGPWTPEIREGDCARCS